KVDRTLVHRMGTRRTDVEILRSIVHLAEHLGLTVTAEGVETAAQRERLIAFGCELGQGFLFAKALEPEAAGHCSPNSGSQIPRPRKTTGVRTACPDPCFRSRRQ